MAFAASVMVGCGGGGGGSSAPTAAPAVAAPAAPAPTAANIARIVVDGGTDGLAFNKPFVSVTVCQPGTSVCATIDHVLVDTGSSGLRLAASTVPATVVLPNAGPRGILLGECYPFVSGYSWGSVRSADVTIAGEQARAIPIQLVNDTSSAFAVPPSLCSNIGASLGVGHSSNGILGVGFSKQDCGSACTTSPGPAMYYVCSASGCIPSMAPLSMQVMNPVAAFAKDNNGVAIVLPQGQPMTGSLIFGIGTQANNQPGDVSILTVDNQGRIKTTYNGMPFASFIDTGSNKLYFKDSSLPQCADGNYCPTSPLNLSGALASPNGNTQTVNFVVDSPLSLAFGATSGNVAADFGGAVAEQFDWGLPFFFGRTVWVGMNGMSSPQLGPGPFWAF